MEIGDRVRANSGGYADHEYLKYDRNMVKGEEGVIIKQDGYIVQIKADDGTLFCRTENYIDVIKPNPEGYEIY